jgi:hypothetical protein
MKRSTAERRIPLWVWLVMGWAAFMPGTLRASGGDPLLDEPKKGAPIAASYVLEALGLQESPRAVAKGDSWGAESREFGEWSRLVDTTLSADAMLDDIGRKLLARGWTPGETIRGQQTALQTWRARDGKDKPWAVLFYVTQSPNLRNANLVLLRLTPLGKPEPRGGGRSRENPGLPLPELAEMDEGMDEDEMDEPAPFQGEPLLIPQEDDRRVPAYRVLQAVGLKEPEGEHRFWSSLETSNRAYNDWNVRVESELSATELLDDLAQKLRTRGWKPAGKVLDGEIALQTWSVEDAEGRPWTALLYVSESDNLPGSRYVLLRLTKLRTPRA